MNIVKLELFVEVPEEMSTCLCECAELVELTVQGKMGKDLPVELVVMDFDVNVEESEFEHKNRQDSKINLAG